MAGYSFSRKQDIEAVLKLIGVETQERIRARPSTRDTYNCLAKTPITGIPAALGDTPGNAECTPYFISLQDKKMLPLLGTDGNPQTVEIYNPFSSPIFGDRFITAKFVYGALVVDAEDCQ